MQLAQALAMRADAAKRIEQVRSRIGAAARHPDGEEPAEDLLGLLADVDTQAMELENLMRRINRTNTSALVVDGMTLTDALARRDALRVRHSVWSRAAEAAAEDPYGYRLSRTEVRSVPAVPVGDLRRVVDEIAREIRTLDLQIQQANWQVSLIE